MIKIEKNLIGLVATSLLLTVVPAFADKQQNVVPLPTGSHELVEYVKSENKILYLADRNELADAITGGVLPGENKSALLTVNSNNISSDEMTIIESASEVYILGGHDRISPELDKLPNFTARFHGQNRYETAVKVANQLGTDRSIAIVSGENYVDAIMATPISVLEDRNILMVSNSGIPACTEEYLKSSGFAADIIYIGGENSLPRAVKEQICKLTGNDPSEIEERTISGDNRYFTSLEVAKRNGTMDSLVLVKGDDFEKAILSVNLMSGLNAQPLLVTEENAADIVDHYLSGRTAEDIYTLGVDVSLSSGDNTILEDQVQQEQPTQEEVPVQPEQPIIAEQSKTPNLSADSFISSALEMSGWMYSQSERMSDGYADCSSLVLKALINSGLTTDTHTNLTSESIWGDARFYQVSYEELSPGDVCYGYGHLAIYMGDGTVFEAKDWGIPAGYGNLGSRFSAFFRVTGL